jgi:hypothetical protein
MKPGMVLPAVLAAIFFSWSAAPVFAQTLPDGERDFVHTLMRRGLFTLAAQYCRSQQSQVTDADLKTQWSIELAECIRQHAWLLPADSRNETQRQAVIEISEFLAKVKPAPEFHLKLRLAQLELLTSLLRMECVLQAPLSRTKSSLPVSPAADRQTSQRLVDDVVQQANELSNALLKQLEERKRDLDSALYREARDRIRFAQALVMASTLQLDTSPAAHTTAATLQQSLREQLELIQRSSSDDRLIFQNQILLAEQMLDDDTNTALDLKLRSLQNEATSDAERAAITALQIRSLLRRNLPSDALQLYVDLLKSGQPVSQELQALRLECLLHLLELLFRLDAAESEPLHTQTAKDFRSLLDKAYQETRGVWHERCQQIAQRFERVVQVGPELASDLEVITDLLSSGDLNMAESALQTALLRLKKVNSPLAAFVNLQLGDLAVRQQNWPVAIEHLQQASSQFQSQQDMPRAASADLLRLFALSRRWNGSPEPNDLKRDYSDALDLHLAAYSDHTTCVQVLEWRALLRRTDSPLSATEDALAAVERLTSSDANSYAATDPADQILKLLNLAGDCLLDAWMDDAQNEFGATDASTATADLASLFERFVSLSDKQGLFSGPGITEVRAARMTPLNRIHSAQRLLLNIALQRTLDWAALGNAARVICLHTSESVSTQKNPAGADAAITVTDELDRWHCQVLRVLTAYRQLLPSGEFADARDGLLTMSWASRFRAARFLAACLRTSENESGRLGDPQLAVFAVELLNAAPNTAAQSVTQQIKRLQVLGRLASMMKSREAFDGALTSLAQQSLTADQLVEIAAVASDVSLNGGTQNSTPALISFWKTVQKASRSGDDLWLEASLQMALAAESAGDVKESLRILKVVDALHPEWGNETRRNRAAVLRKQLETSQ